MKVFSKLVQKLPPEFENAASLVIASGAITVTQQFNRVDTEGSAASDDLTTINGTTAFKVLYLRPNNSARTVVIKHNVGNIKCFGDADITLDDNHDCVILVWDEIGNVWCALAASSGGAGVLLANASVPGTGVQEFLGLNLTDPTNLTIASGAITLTQGAHRVDTEAGAGEDDLVTITAAKGVGDIAFLCPVDDSRSIILKHGTGNILTFNGRDVCLSTQAHMALLLRTGSFWYVIANTPAGWPIERSYFPSGNLADSSVYFWTAKRRLYLHRGEIEVGGTGDVPAAVSVLKQGSAVAVAFQASTAIGGAGAGRYYGAANFGSVVCEVGDVISLTVEDGGTPSTGGSGTPAAGPLDVTLYFSEIP